jgi:hypothetical protein
MNNNPMMVFIDQLLIDKGVEGLDKDVLNQLKEDIAVRLRDRINVMLISHVPNSKLDELNKFIGADDTEGVQNFFGQNVEDMETKIAGEMLAFRKLYIK